MKSKRDNSAVEWIVRPSLAELTPVFVERIRGLAANDAIALTGGSAVRNFYVAWARAGVASSQRFYWSDERHVPKIDPDSNYRLAHENLLQPAGVAAERIHPVPTHLPPAECALAYANDIRERVGRFPLIMLGLGSDGHTASLFPHRDPYLEDDLLVRVAAESEEHPHTRITFTPRLINQADQVWFLVAGESKVEAVEQLYLRTAPVTRMPSLVVDPSLTRITVFCDGAAASRIRP